MFSISSRLKTLWAEALDYVFPKECLNCQKEGEYLCSACFAKIELFEQFPCFICNSGQYEVGICPECQEQTSIDQIVIACTYTNNIAGQLVEQFKYNYLEELKKLLGQLLIKQIQKQGLNSVFYAQKLVPVPLHKIRLAERGFNQASELAKQLRVKYNCQLEQELVQRQENTLHQAKLNRQQRLRNLQNAFRINIRQVIPEQVILIDDVLTTGATFSEIAKTCKAAGIKKVVCSAVCHG